MGRSLHVGVDGELKNRRDSLCLDSDQSIIGDYYHHVPNDNLIVQPIPQCSVGTLHCGISNVRGECPVAVAYGKSETGKTTVLKTALSIFWIESYNNYTCRYP